MSPHRYFCLLILIAVTGVAARAFHFNLTGRSDEKCHRLAASEFGATRVSGLPACYYMRAGMNAVLFAWSQVFGMSLKANAVLMFILCVTTFFLFSAACRILLGEGAALMAAALFWLHPIALIYDPHVASDSFALPVMMAAVLLFLKHLDRNRIRCLVGAGLLAGVVFTMKEYYVLILLPFAICILRTTDKRSRKFRKVVILAVGALCGVALDPVLNYIDSGDWLAHAGPMLDYGERILQRDGPAAMGLKGWLKLLLARFTHLGSVLLNYGIAGGIVLVAGWSYLIMTVRSPRQTLPLAASLVFFFFLSFMPVSLHPLTFVEQQARYALVWIPFLAMGAGQAVLVVLNSVADTNARRAAVLALLLHLGVNLSIPNKRSGNDPMLHYHGLRKVIKDSQRLEISDIVCPWGYGMIIPEEIVTPGITLKFAKMPVGDQRVPANEFGDISEFLTAPKTAFYVPARFIDSTALAEVEQETGLSNREIPDLRAILEGAGLRASEVRVPASSTSAWAAYFGMPIRGTSIGLFYVKGADGR